jgi:ASC-1-like (ASCH) protein
MKSSIEYPPIKLQLNMNTKETKKNIIQAGQRAVEELIKVAKEAIVDSDDDISADRLKNAAATKKLAIFDAFEILSRIEEEENMLENKPKKEIEKKAFKGFAEKRSK